MTRPQRRGEDSSAASVRMRKRRHLWGHIDRKRWTERDLETLLLHIECFGYAWTLIAHSMQRSPDAIRNKLVRLYQRAQWTRRQKARAWLEELVDALGLDPPACWGREDEEDYECAEDVPAPVFQYRKGAREWGLLLRAAAEAG
jgi:hypothetical protein